MYMFLNNRLVRQEVKKGIRKKVEVNDNKIHNIWEMLLRQC